MKTQNTTPTIENEYLSFDDLFEDLRQQLSVSTSCHLKGIHKNNAEQLELLQTIKENNLESFSQVLPFVFDLLKFTLEAERMILRVVKRQAKNKIKDSKGFPEGSNPEDHPNFYFCYAEGLINAIERFQRMTEKVIVKRFIQS